MKSYRILGMMSGTSLDGLDLALAVLQFEKDRWSYTLEATNCIPYDDPRRKELDGAIRLQAPGLLALHAAYGKWLGDQARAFLEQIKGEVDAIASHGHTVHHRPEEGFTFQLGCPQQIALQTGRPVIGDFRSLDVALGGQGAPLVPVGDRLLFGSFDFCLNLGGISNLSLEREGQRIAFDIGIANMLLNHICRGAGLEYDEGGALARSGNLNPDLLRALDGLEYYQKPLPKSTGFEWFRDKILPVLSRFPDRLENLLHTATVHIARQAGRTLRELSTGPGRVLVSGGGAMNTYLMEKLSEAAGSELKVVIPDPQLIAYKEALVFALLAALRLEGQNNVLASVTGASRDSCSGVLYLP